MDQSQTPSFIALERMQEALRAIGKATTMPTSNPTKVGKWDVLLGLLVVVAITIVAATVIAVTYINSTHRPPETKVAVIHCDSQVESLTNDLCRGKL